MPTGKPNKKRPYNGIVEMKDGTYYTVTYLANKYKVSDFTMRERLKHYRLQPNKIGIMEVYPDDERLNVDFKFRPRTPNPGDFRPGYDSRRVTNKSQMELVNDIVQINNKVEALALAFPHLDGLVHNLMAEVLFIQELITTPYVERKKRWEERYLTNNGTTHYEGQNSE